MIEEMLVMASRHAVAIRGPGGSIAITRERLADTLETLHAIMDVIDHDGEDEPNGDELDGSAAEDDFMDHAPDGQPGCPVADPGEPGAWIERVDQTRSAYGRRGSAYIQCLEDAENDDPKEDDDPGGGNVTDEPHDPLDEGGY